jgi:hypothetical protein
MPKKSRRSKRGGFDVNSLNPFGSSGSSPTSSSPTSSPKSGWSDWFMGKKPETSPETSSYNTSYGMTGGYEPNMSQTRFNPSSIVGGRTRRRRRHKHGKSCRNKKSCRR